MNGTVDARHVLKKAMGVKMDDDLKKGVTSQDILLFLKEVVRMNAEEGKEVNYVWKREGLNHSVEGRGWSGKHCEKTFSGIGKFVILGRAKKKDDIYLRRMRIMTNRKMSKDAVEKYFSNYAKGNLKVDHAVSVSIEEDGRTQLYDNGCDEKEYSILNLASRMEDVKSCYKIDLFYV